jgi:hypothetical protein
MTSEFVPSRANERGSTQSAQGVQISGERRGRRGPSTRPSLWESYKSMEKLVYALFDDHDQAAAAVDDMLANGVPKDVVSVVMHEGHLHAEDVQNPGTQAKRFAWAGGLATGVAAAVAGGMVAGSSGMVGVGPLAVALFSGAYGTLLGGLVAAISGSSDAKPQIEHLAAEVEKGKVLVTIDLAKKRAAVRCEDLLERHGAHHIGMV